MSLASAPPPPPCRFSAQFRQYKYFIVQRQAGSGPACLDIGRMREAAQHFVGEHDFRNFCKVSSARDGRGLVVLPVL